MATGFTREILLTGAQVSQHLAAAVAGGEQGAGEQGATTQGVQGGTGKSVRSRGPEWKKIGKSSSELQLKRNRDRGSRDLQFWRSLDPLSRFLLSWSSEEFFLIFFHSCPPELIKA